MLAQWVMLTDQLACACHGDRRRLSRLSMSGIDQDLSDLADEFELLGDWEERYRYVIELGRDLAPMTDAERSEANKVRGCASQVWLVTEPQADGAVNLRGDSDAHIVRGLIAVLLLLLSGRSPTEILAFDAQAAFGRLGLASHLSAQRSNGLASMVERIRRDAAALSQPKV
jgi:cysteine desulfuration protein SufE